ncbi:MAG: rhomboid family intramembrane serine protease [Syntrophales bacterium]|jgi:membrane associated rhomboid family serine protease|nr:rhomboid family intramembrane serine protease [Syntrophales bacterium]
MIPIRDTIRSKNYPVINMTLILVNVIVYFIQLGHFQNLEAFIFTYGLVPARYTVPEVAAHFSFGQQILACISFMFLHGGFWHILGNMWFLYIFGDNVEDKIGPFRYLFFYLICGWISGLTHVLFNFHSSIPTIGASGAVAGVMGAYFITYPYSKILTLIPIVFIPFFVEIPAAVFLGIWFIIQFFSSISNVQASTIAWWAHVGGFVAGIVLFRIIGMLPDYGFATQVRTRTVRERSPKLHMIKNGDKKNNDFYGVLTITPREAETGTRKTVSIPLGFSKTLFSVNIPPGIQSGQTIRLAGIGNRAGMAGGDAFLKIVVE